MLVLAGTSVTDLTCEHCLAITLQTVDTLCQEPSGADEVADAALDLIEAHGAATLALQMVDQRAQSGEVLSALSAEAVVEGLLICEVPLARYQIHPAGVASCS